MTTTRRTLTGDQPRKVKSEVAQSCPTLCDPMDCSLPGSSIHGIFQARVLEWVAISFSRGSSRPKDRTRVSRIVGRCFVIWATREIHPGRLVTLKNILLIKAETKISLNFENVWPSEHSNCFDISDCAENGALLHYWGLRVNFLENTLWKESICKKMEHDKWWQSNGKCHTEAENPELFLLDLWFDLAPIIPPLTSLGSVYLRFNKW